MDWTTEPPERGIQYWFTRPFHGTGRLERSERKMTNPAFWHAGSDWPKAVAAGWWRSRLGSELKGEVPDNAYVRFPDHPIPAPPEAFDEAASLHSGKTEAVVCDGCAGGGTAIKANVEAMAECSRCEGFGILFQTHEFGACSVSRVRELTKRGVR